MKQISYLFGCFDKSFWWLDKAVTNSVFWQLFILNVLKLKLNHLSKLYVKSVKIWVRQWPDLPGWFHQPCQSVIYELATQSYSYVRIYAFSHSTKSNTEIDTYVIYKDLLEN